MKALTHPRLSPPCLLLLLLLLFVIYRSLQIKKIFN
jgi:hypothetical protein